MTWAGADIYTCDGAFPQEIRLATASGAFGGVISEYVVGAVLCLYRRFPEYIENQRSALWRDAGAERTLEGKTALILGTGDIGSNVAKRLSAFGTKISAFAERALSRNILKRYTPSRISTACCRKRI